MSKHKLNNKLTMTSENTAPCQQKFNFTATKDIMKKETGKVVREISNQVVIPGFRKGKAPVGMIQSRFRENVVDQLKRQLYNMAFHQIAEDKTLDIVSYGMPSEEQPMELKEEYRFSLSFELAPQFDLPEYKGIKVTLPPIEISEDKINERLDYYRNMYATYVNIDIPAEKGDLLKVSYTSDFDLPDEASAALKRQVEADDNWLWLNDPELIPGAIEALVGAEKDKDYSFKAVYPEDWRDSALAGKTITYQLKVKEVQQRKPLADDELKEKMQLESIDQLAANIREEMEREAERKRSSDIGDEVFAAIDKEIGEFELPPVVLRNETDKELKKIARDKVKTEEDAEVFKKEIDEHRRAAEPVAKQELRKMFICRKIAEQEKITVEQHEISGQLKDMSRYYGYKEKELLAMMEKNGAMEDMHMDMLKSKVFAFLIDHADTGNSKPNDTEAQTSG